MREHQAITAEVGKLRTAADRFKTRATSAAAWIEIKAGEIAGELAKNPRNRGMSLEAVHQRAMTEARAQWRQLRAQEAGDLTATTASVRALIQDAARRAMEIVLPDPADLDEKTASRLITGEKVLVIEQRQTRRELQLLRHTVAYQGLSLAERVTALGEAQAAQDWSAAAFLDQAIGAAVQKLPDTAEERHTFEALRRARIPKDFGDNVKALEAELASATADALALASQEAIEAKTERGERATTDDIIALRDAMRAAKAAQEPATA